MQLQGAVQQRRQQQQTTGRRRARRDECEISNLSAVNQLSSVKHFYGNNMMMTDASIQYLMHKFPQLDTLRLNTTPYVESCRIILKSFELSDPIMLAFFQYLSRMSGYETNGSFIGQDPTQVVGILIDAEQLQHPPTTRIANSRYYIQVPMMKKWDIFHS